MNKIQIYFLLDVVLGVASVLQHGVAPTGSDTKSIHPIFANNFSKRENAEIEIEYEKFIYPRHHIHRLMLFQRAVLYLTKSNTITRG